MTPQEFCYWLQGFFEITQAERDITSVTEAQVRMIKNHLQLVFAHSIDAPDPTGKLQDIHDGVDKKSPLDELTMKVDKVTKTVVDHMKYGKHDLGKVRC